jgi:hypothetical protein
MPSFIFFDLFGDCGFCSFFGEASRTVSVILILFRAKNAADKSS